MVVRVCVNCDFVVCDNIFRMENAEEVFQCLEDFTKRRPKVIPRELEDYLNFVARTGDPVYQWALIKNLFKEKLLNVITEFFETTPGLDIPQCPNVDLFNYETMKNSLLEKIDAFVSAPFTVQRICELLTAPRKQYTRIDKFMRAFEKNILVVSTRDPGPLRRSESENGEGPEAMVNGSDSNSDYNVDVEMEDMSSWKENADPLQTYPVQPGSSESNRSIDTTTTPFVSQNGPLQEAPTSSELMTIVPDSNHEGDIPEPSTSLSEAVLSPDQGTRNNNNPLPEPSDEPASTLPAESPPTAPKVPAPEESVESTENSDAVVVSTTQESKPKLESAADTPSSTNSIEPIEEHLPKDEIEDSPVSTPVELKEVTSNITDDTKVVTSNTEMESTPSPDTSSEEKVTESMECQEFTTIPESKTEIEAAPTVVLESPVTEEPAVEVSASIEMEDNDSKDDEIIESDSTSPVTPDAPQSPKKDASPKVEVVITESIEDVVEAAPVVITPAEESIESVETDDKVSSSITETIPEQTTPEAISVDTEITSTRELEIPTETTAEAEPSDKELVDIVPATEVMTEESTPPSPEKEVVAEPSASGDS